jgi:hypothetical protein
VTITIYALLVVAALVRAFILLFDPYNVRGIGGLGIYYVFPKSKQLILLILHFRYIFFCSVLVQVIFGIPIACLFGMYVMILVLWYVNKRT